MPFLYGPLTGLGLLMAALALVADQASKLWLLYVFDLGAKGDVALTPFFALTLVWNTGISYGLFPQDGSAGQWGLFAVKIVAVILLWIWLARANSRLIGVALGLIIGGALGNAVDRVAHGAVVDFALFHITTATFQFNWYVFNLADVAIVVGVTLVLYESLLRTDAVKAP